MILSRPPIVSSRNHLLPKYATLTQHSIQQGALEAVIATERGGPVRVYSTHLSHLSAATRLPQVDALLAIHARAPSEGGAWCGGHPDPEAGGPRAGCRRCPPTRSWRAISISPGIGGVRAHRRPDERALRPAQSHDRLRGRVGRRRAPRGRRGDRRQRQADRLLLRVGAACAARALGVDRRRRRPARTTSRCGSISTSDTAFDGGIRRRNTARMWPTPRRMIDRRTFVAKALGIAIPTAVLARAEVVQ